MHKKYLHQCTSLSFKRGGKRRGIVYFYIVNMCKPVLHSINKETLPCDIEGLQASSKVGVFGYKDQRYHLEVIEGLKQYSTFHRRVAILGLAM